MIATLTLVWIPLDVIGLERSELLRILPLRLVLAVLLLRLAASSPRRSSNTTVVLLVWLQAFVFGAMQLSLEPMQGSALRLGYGLFPFVIGAQLALFPVPWGRNVCNGLGPITLLVMPMVLQGRTPGPAFWNNLWLLALLISLAAWAGHSQLLLLVDLLGARSDASHDTLTGLANRRSAERKLEADRARAFRLPEPLSVLMIDLDHFKLVNDRWGHACGDRVLVETANVLKEELRGADLPSRYGGEEFLAILPGSGAVEAMQVAERVREHIARLEVVLARGVTRVTASFGIATLEPGEPTASLIARADGALYRAKGEGRNRCAVAVSVAESGAAG